MISRFFRKSLVLWVAFVGFFWAVGCPSPSPTPDGSTPTDGGSDLEQTTNPLTCEAGTACFVIGNADVRACDVLLKNEKDIQSPQVNFDADVIGLFKYRDVRLAISFILQKDGKLDDGKFAVLVKLGEGVGKLEVAQATCYDRKGAKVEKPDFKMERP